LLESACTIATAVENFLFLVRAAVTIRNAADKSNAHLPLNAGVGLIERQLLLREAVLRHQLSPKIGHRQAVHIAA